MNVFRQQHQKLRGAAGDWLDEADSRKQLTLTTVFSLTSIFLLTVFGIHALLTQNTLLFVVCLAGAIFNLINFVYLRFTGKYRNACVVILLLMVFLAFFLVCSGGAGKTGPLWFYCIPILSFYVLELRRGLLLLLVLYGMLTAILLVPDNPLLVTTYSAVFVSRFLGSLFAVSVLAFGYEYSRQVWRREILELNMQLDRLSRTDVLTGLSNRRDMLEILYHEIARFKQNKRPFCLVITDIDHFKKVNDACGHGCGDQVLQKIAAVLDVGTKEQDVVSRWGGEEFLILMPETDKTKGLQVAERLRQAIEDLVIQCEERQLQVTMSFGVECYDQQMSLSEIISRADKNLYTSKREGRNRVT